MHFKNLATNICEGLFFPEYPIVMFKAPTEEGSEYKTGTNKFSSPKTTATLSREDSGFSLIKSSIMLPAILAWPIVFGVPIILMFFA